MEELLFETRSVSDIKIDEENRVIRGTAIVFEQESGNLGGFTEVIKRGAITQEFVDQQDVVMVYNHNSNNGVLARRNKGKGSLDIQVDDQGVHFAFRAKKTNLGEEILQGVKEGDLSGCSFRFGIRKNNTNAIKIIRRDNNIPLQEVHQIDALQDLSIVTEPAYPQTSVFARALADLQTKEAEDQKKFQELEDQKRQAEIQKENDFKNYYNKVLREYLYL